MTEEIKAKLKDIWSKEHLEFNNFQVFKQEKNQDRLLEKFPQKYCEVQENSSEDEVEITEERVSKSKGKGAKKKKPIPTAKKTPAAKKTPPPFKSPVIRRKGAFRMGKHSLLKHWGQ